MFNNWIIMVIHELGHAIFLLLKNIPIVGICVPFVSMHFGDKIEYKILSSWESKGLVISDIQIINNESEFKQLKKIYTNFLSAGPVGTIIFYMIQMGSFFAMQHYCHKLKSYLVVLILHTSIKTFFLLRNCFKELRNNIGDIVAAERIKNDNFFFTKYVYCCYFFSGSYKSKIREAVYIKKIVKEHLSYMSEEELINEIDLLDEIIYRSISGLDDYFNDYLNGIIYLLVDVLFDSMTNHTDDKNSVISTYFHILMYIIIVSKDSNQALKLYLQAQDFLQLDEPMCKYLNSEVRYLLNIEIDKPEEVYPVIEYENWNFYTQYYNCENIILDKRQIV